MSGGTPEGWRVGSLGEVLVDARPGFASGANVPDGVVQIRMNNVTRAGDLDWSKVRRVPATVRGIERFYVQAGDLVFNATNSPELVGKCAVFPGYDEPVTFSNHFLRLRIDQRAADPRYVNRWLSLQWAQGQFERMCRQWVNQASISRDRLLALILPLPPAAEQRRIAAILDQADELRAKRRRAIGRLDALGQALFADIFQGDASRLWPRHTIASLATRIRTGPFGSQLLHSEFVDSGIAVLGIDNVVQNEFSWAKPRFITESKFRGLKRYAVTPGDVLITIMGTCGRCAVVPDGIPLAINTKHLCCITLDTKVCAPRYLQSSFLLHPDVRLQLGLRERGAMLPGLNMQLIKELVVPLPPRCIQEAFVEKLRALDRLRTALRESLAKLDVLFASLQHRAFRGEL